MCVCVCVCVGWGGEPTEISTIVIFLDTHRRATKSGDVSQNILENKILEKFSVKGITNCHCNTVFDAMFGEILVFFLKY